MPETKPGPVPELRFPEFRDAGPWEVKRLGELVETVTPPKKLQTSEYLPSGRFPIIDQSPSDVCGWTNDGTAMVQADFPLVVFGDHSCVVKLAGGPFAQGADGIKILAPTSEIEARFLFLSLQADPIEQKGYKRHFSTLKEKLKPFPRKDTGEQQKIADCLGSLDDLIRAEERRLEALSAHRTGLMQRLFAAPGQTTPRLRFPEFRDAGPWEVKRLGDVCEITNGSSNAQDHDELGKYPLFDRSLSVKKSDKFLFDTEAAIIPGEGSEFAPRYFVGKFDLHQRAYALMNFVALGRFIYFLMDRTKGLLAEQAVKSTVLSLRMPILENFLITLPSLPEQQKIADCLTALDDLIRAQGETIEALKTHKRGLMQKLFPREVG